MAFDGRDRVSRRRRAEMEGDISPEREALSREIPVTRPETGSQETPRNRHGDSVSCQESRRFSGSWRWDLNSRSARVSIRRGWDGGKVQQNMHTRRMTVVSVGAWKKKDFFIILKF